LSYLRVGESALLPAFMEPQSITLPPADAPTVEHAHARLALLNRNCSVIILAHPVPPVECVRRRLPTTPSSAER